MQTHGDQHVFEPQRQEFKPNWLEFLAATGASVPALLPVKQATGRIASFFGTLRETTVDYVLVSEGVVVHDGSAFSDFSFDMWNRKPDHIPQVITICFVSGRQTPPQKWRVCGYNRAALKKEGAEKKLRFAISLG